MNAQTSIEKAVDVLFHLHAASAPVGVTQLGRALGLPKSSAHRLLAALGRRGLVRRDERGRYEPGLGLIALGLGAQAREPIVGAARDVLESESRELGETVFLVAERERQLVVLDKAEGSGFLRAAPRVGSAVPVHATAVGKLFLAFGGLRLGEHPLERFTARTLTRTADLERAVDRARCDGAAVSCEEWIPGLSVVAAPVLVRGRMEGSLALGAATPHLAAREERALVARMRAAAERVAARLEGRSDG